MQVAFGLADEECHGPEGVAGIPTAHSIEDIVMIWNRVAPGRSAGEVQDAVTGPDRMDDDHV